MPRDEARAHVKEVMALVERVRPLFAGRAPDVQGAALAELLAVWLAGHVVPGDPEGTERARSELLQQHLFTVRELVPINFKALMQN